MSNFDVSFWSAVMTCLFQAADDVGYTMTIADAVSRSVINQADWQSLILDRKLEPPYYVLSIGERSEEPMGLHSMSYVYPLDIIGVFSRADSLVADDPDAFANAWSSAIRDRLYNYDDGAFDMPFKPRIDNSDMNPANQVFTQSNHSLWATRVMANLRTGEIYT